MLRLLHLCFTLLLPLQFAWAGAAAYCEHETSVAAAAHWGHHAHVHEGETGPAKPGGAFSADPDCGACHAGGIILIADLGATQPLTSGSARAVSAAPAPIASALARAPERPQWLRLA